LLLLAMFLLLVVNRDLLYLSFTSMVFDMFARRILWPNHGTVAYNFTVPKFNISHFAELGSQCSYTVTDNSLI